MKCRRDYVIVEDDVGKTLLVHNGLEFVSIFIEVEMVGFKLGEFSLTKQKLYHIHTKKNKKKKR